MKPDHDTTEIAGVDVSKDKLDIVLLNSGQYRSFANRRECFGELVAWLNDNAVGRVGLEATGNYEHDARVTLLEADFEVIVHQPADVRHLAGFRRIRHKNDKADARLIAQATALSDRHSRPHDPRQDSLAAIMTLNDHVTGQLAQCKSFRDHITDDFVKEQIDKLIVCLQAQKKEVEARLHAVVRTDRALHDRYAILLSIPGIGPLVGLSLLARMPELGSLKKGQSASLLGVAPFDHESGRFKGQRRISGGRHRPRRHLYMAALGAIRTRNSPFRSFSHRLVDKGKPKKVAIVAVMRKLIELANLLLQENRKWALDYHPQAANSSP